LVLRLRSNASRFALYLKAKAGARAPELCRKTPKIEVFGVSDPLSDKFRNSVPKEFMMTSIHVLCSNFKEIGRREQGETMRCFGYRKVRKMRVFVAILLSFGGGGWHQMFALFCRGACHLNRRLRV